jgi:hypothetical protein
LGKIKYERIVRSNYKPFVLFLFKLRLLIRLKDICLIKRKMKLNPIDSFEIKEENEAKIAYDN